MITEYEYDQDADELLVFRTRHEDGGRTPVEEVERIPLVECAVDLLREAMEQLDPTMLEIMGDDDDQGEWAICFRSMFMRLEEALEAHDRARKAA